MNEKSPKLKSGNKGAILGAVMVMVAIVALVCTGLIRLLAAEQYESKRRLQSLQSFWTAEAGVQETVFRLETDKIYRETGYATDLTILQDDYYNAGINVAQVSSLYAITAQGRSTKSGLERGIREIVKLKPLPIVDYVFYSEEGPVDINDNVSVSGDLFCANGDIAFGNNYDIDGHAYDQTGEVYPDDSGYMPDPFPTMPGIDTDWYDGEISTAETTGSSAVPPADLGGGTYYINGDVRLGTTLTGPGTIVVSGSVVLGNNVHVGNDVMIVAGVNIDLNNGAFLERDSILFSRGTIDFKNQGLVSDGGTIIALGAVEFKNSMEYRGLIITLSELDVKNNMTIQGAAITLGAVDIEQNANLIYDPDMFPDPLPPGITPPEEYDSETMIAEVLSWEEI